MAPRINLDPHTIADLATLGSTILDLSTATYHALQWVWTHVGGGGASSGALTVTDLNGVWYCACHDQGLVHVDCRLDPDCICDGMCPEARRAKLDAEMDL